MAGAQSVVWAQGPVTPSVKEQIMLPGAPVPFPVSLDEPGLTPKEDLMKLNTEGTELDQFSPVSGDGATFYIADVLLEGNSVFSDLDLRPIILPLLDEEVSFGDLKRAAEEMTRLYRINGFVTSYAFVPPQKITDDTVTFTIVEGKYSDVDVKDNVYFKDKVYVRDLGIEASDVVNVQDLEAGLRTIGSRPDRKLRGYLKEGKVPGATELILKAEEENPIHISYAFNNRGSKFTHRARHKINVTHNNLTGNGDSMRLSFTVAEELAVAGLDMLYDFPDFANDRTYHFQYGKTKTRLRKHLKDDDIDGLTLVYGAGVTQQFKRTPLYQLEGYLGFTATDSKTTFLDDKITYDRMRVLSLGPRWEFTDRGGRTFVNSTLNLGIPGLLGGSKRKDPLASKVNAGGQFQYLEGSLARIQRMPWDTLIVSQFAGQLSYTALTVTEQMSLGGMYTVRGYPESDYLADSGLRGSLEYRIPAIPPLGKWDRYITDERLLSESLFFTVFVEGAQGFNHKRQRSDSKKTKTLLSAGVGMRGYLNEDTNFQLDFGFPFGEPSTDKDRMQVHVALEAGFY